MEDIGQLIFFIVMILIYSLGAILKKANEWINRKRMEVDRHPSSSEREVIHDGWPPPQPGLPPQPSPRPQPSLRPQPSPRPQPAPRQPQPSRDIAQEILEQFEMMLPPEIQEVRRKAREMARQRPTPPPAPPPEPVKPKAKEEKKKPAPQRHVHAADRHYEGALKKKPILQQLGVNTSDDLRRVFLFQEILKPPIADRPPTPFFE